MIITVILLALSLSMDAFSLSILFGTMSLKRSQKIVLSSLVGIFHFFMPLFGHMIGNEILEHLELALNIVVFASFFAIGVDMVWSLLKKEHDTFSNSILGFIIFSFTVSVDSFITGFGLDAFSKDSILCSVIFCIASFIFTYLGLSIGNRASEKIGKYATLFGAITLFGMAFYYLFGV